ncbi:hypothetical protein DFH09DRAFT_1455081 [Mycena vulgaris]|nr:hypothetical protein DFH09DRAFT_1455081 [Mycena vulgaris]
MCDARSPGAVPATATTEQCALFASARDRQYHRPSPLVACMSAHEDTASEPRAPPPAEAARAAPRTGLRACMPPLHRRRTRASTRPAQRPQHASTAPRMRIRAHIHVVPAGSSAIHNASCICVLQPPRILTARALSIHLHPQSQSVRASAPRRAERRHRHRAASASAARASSTRSPLHDEHSTPAPPSPDVRTRLASHPYAPGSAWAHIARCITSAFARIRTPPLLQARERGHHTAQHPCPSRCSSPSAAPPPCA